MNDRDMQRMLDGMLDMGRITRAHYHVTLGGLIKFLTDIEVRGKGSQPVVFSDDYNTYPCDIESYRGYFCDLALTDDGHIDGGATVTSLLSVLNDALDQKFTGYKGGEFIMDRTTPLWRARYGQAPDHAIVSAISQTIHIGGAVVLQIKRLDDYDG